MLQWYALQMLGGIEHAVGKVGDGLMHTSLPVEHSGEIGAPCVGLKSDEPLEKRLSAVGKTCLTELPAANGREGFGLLHDGRQLLVVAYEDEFGHARQQTDERGLKNLAGLVDDGTAEMLHLEDGGRRLKACCRSDDDVHALHFLTYLTQVATFADGVAQQMGGVAAVAGERLSDAQVVETRPLKHSANLVYRTVGISHEQNVPVLILPDEILQGHGGFASSRWSHEQEVVGGLHGLENHLVVIGIVGMTKLHRGVFLGRALS